MAVRDGVEQAGSMAAGRIRIFRGTHREVRLRPVLAGREAQQEVRPLSLTLSLQKFINIKDAKSRVSHEEPIIIPGHAPSLS
jgi:hypothetical protein